MTAKDWFAIARTLIGSALAGSVLIGAGLSEAQRTVTSILAQEPYGSAILVLRYFGVCWLLLAYNVAFWTGWHFRAASVCTLMAIGTGVLFLALIPQEVATLELLAELAARRIVTAALVCWNLASPPRWCAGARERPRTLRIERVLEGANPCRD